MALSDGNWSRRLCSCVMALFYLGSIGNIYGEGKPPVRRRSPALCAQAEKRHPGRIGVPWEHPLASPLGRGGRAQRGRRGKTMTISFENGCTALSVTCGDSSPKGRAGELDPVTSVTSYVGMKKWSVSVLIRSIDCFVSPHRKKRAVLCYFSFSGGRAESSACPSS